MKQAHFSIFKQDGRLWIDTVVLVSLDARHFDVFPVFSGDQGRNSELCPLQKKCPFRAHFSRDVAALARPPTNDMHRNRRPALIALRHIGVVLLSANQGSTEMDTWKRR